MDNLKQTILDAGKIVVTHKKSKDGKPYKDVYFDKQSYFYGKDENGFHLTNKETKVKTEFKIAKHLPKDFGGKEWYSTEHDGKEYFTSVQNSKYCDKFGNNQQVIYFTAKNK